MITNIIKIFSIHMSTILMNADYQTIPVDNTTGSQYLNQKENRIGKREGQISMFQNPSQIASLSQPKAQKNSWRISSFFKGIGSFFKSIFSRKPHESKQQEKAKDSPTSMPAKFGAVVPPPPPPPPPPPSELTIPSREEEGPQSIKDVKLIKVEQKKKEPSHLDLIKAGEFKLKPIDKSEKTEVKTVPGQSDASKDLLAELSKRRDMLVSKEDDEVGYIYMLDAKTEELKALLGEATFNDIIAGKRLLEKNDIETIYKAFLYIPENDPDAILMKGEYDPDTEEEGEDWVDYSQAKEREWKTFSDNKSQKQLFDDFKKEIPGLAEILGNKVKIHTEKPVSVGTPVPPPPPPAPLAPQVPSDKEGQSFLDLIKQGVKLKKVQPMPEKKPVPSESKRGLSESEALRKVFNERKSEKWDVIPEKFSKEYKDIDSSWNNSNDDEDDEVKEKAKTLLNNILKEVGGEENIEDESDLSDKVERLKSIIDGTAEKEEEW